MSTNITSFKVKKLENLVIPMTAFYESEEKDWHPSHAKVIDPEKNTVQLDCGCGQTIDGVLQDGNLHVTKLYMSGEGSGNFFAFILEPALHKSSGILQASLIWEGESLEKLDVNNGKVTKENIEL